MNGTTATPEPAGTPAPAPQAVSAKAASPKTVLVTGATGYIGGRLVPRLLEAGHRVKVVVRTPAKIAGVPWLDDVEVVHSSLDDGDALREALNGVDVLYYLVHSMAAGAGFEAREKAMAGTAAQAAAAAGVDRIVYLGGLHPAGAELSTHMRSREAVGKVFLDSPVDAVVFQAGVVIGSGSASFEMIRHLSETLPLMPAPSWVRNKIEAIAVRDVLYYLVAAASLAGTINRTFDIGCRQVLSYAGMMQEYAAEAGLPHRVVLALPVPAPKLAGLWVALVTPIPLSMSLPLVESLQHDAISREHDIDAYIPVPEGGLTSYRRAVALALGKERDGQVETTWASAGVDADPLPSDPDWSGHTVFVDERSFPSDVDPKHVWTVIEGIGGRNGWYSLPLAWQVRGWLDKLTGGAGLAARPPAPAPAGGGRGGGLVARRADRAWPTAAASGRNAGPGPGLARTFRGAGGDGQPLPPARHLLPEGPQRASLLARRVAVSQRHISGHVAEHHRRCPGSGNPRIGACRAHHVGCWEPKTSTSTSLEDPHGTECIHHRSAQRRPRYRGFRQ